MKKFFIGLFMALLLINVVNAVTVYTPSSFAGLCDSVNSGICQITTSKSLGDVWIKDFVMLNFSNNIYITQVNTPSLKINITNVSVIKGNGVLGGIIYTTSTPFQSAGDVNINVSNIVNMHIFSSGSDGANGIFGAFNFDCTSPPGCNSAPGQTGGSVGRVSVIVKNDLNKSEVYTHAGKGGNAACGGDANLGCPGACCSNSVGLPAGTSKNVTVKAKNFISSKVYSDSAYGGNNGGNIFCGCGNTVGGGINNREATETLSFNKIIDSNVKTITYNLNITNQELINSTISAGSDGVLPYIPGANQPNIIIKSNKIDTNRSVKLVTASPYGKIRIDSPNNIRLSDIFNWDGANGRGAINITGSKNIRVGNVTSGTLRVIGQNITFDKLLENFGSGITVIGKRVLQRGILNANSPLNINCTFFNKTASIGGNPIRIDCTSIDWREKTVTGNGDVTIKDTFLKVYANYSVPAGTLTWLTNGTIKQFIPYWQLQTTSVQYIKFNYTKFFEGKLIFDKELVFNTNRFNWSNNNSKQVEFTLSQSTSPKEVNSTSIDGVQNFTVLKITDSFTGIKFTNFNLTVDGNKFFSTTSGKLITNISSTISNKHNLTFRGALFITKNFINYDTSNWLSTNALFYRKRINISAYDTVNNKGVKNFTAYVTQTPFILGTNATTTNGKAMLFLEWNKTSNIFIDAKNYALANKTFYSNLTNISIAKLNVSLFISNTVFLTFLDELTSQLVTGRNITIEFVNGVIKNNYTTSTGKKRIDGLASGDYVLRYSSLPSYFQSFYAFTLPPRGFINLTLYMANTSVFSIVTATVYDEINHRVENAKIEVMKYQPSSGNFILTEICLTNFEGECQIKTILANEFYKFNVRYNNQLKFSSANPTYIFKNTINFQITIGTEVGTKFFNLQGIDYQLIYNNATNNFRLDYSDSKGITQSACLRVDRTYGITKTLIQDKCNVGAAGTILVPITPLNDAKFTATAYTIASPPTVLQTLVQVFSTNNATGLLGLYFIWLLTFIFPFIAIWKPPLAFILTPLPLLFGSAIGIVNISIAITVPLELLGLILAYFVSDRS